MLGIGRGRRASNKRVLRGVERFPAEWNHSAGKKSLQIQKLEHILVAQIDST
jgi:hypothetical protein